MTSEFFYVKLIDDLNGSLKNNACILFLDTEISNPLFTGS